MEARARHVSRAYSGGACGLRVGCVRRGARSATRITPHAVSQAIVRSIAQGSPDDVAGLAAGAVVAEVAGVRTGVPERTNTNHESHRHTKRET